MSDGAKKYDGEKWDPYLAPYGGMIAASRAGHFGIAKYALDNYRENPGLDPSRLLKAGIRHALARLNGEKFDPESGLDHLDHFAWCAMAAAEIVRLYGDARLERRFADAPVLPPPSTFAEVHERVKEKEDEERASRGLPIVGLGR